MFDEYGAVAPKPEIVVVQEDTKNSMFFFFSSRRRHTRFDCDWSSDVCSSDLHDRTIGGCIECGMETPVPPAPGLHLRIILKRLFVLAKDVFSALELIFLHIRDRAAQHVALQDRACFKQLHDLAGRESRNNSASICDNGNEPFSRQMAESFTHRNTADLKFGGNGVLPKLFSFAQFATEDFFCEPLDNSSRKGLSGDRCGLFWGDRLHNWAKTHKHHDTGNFASKISTLKNIEQSLRKLKRHGTQMIIRYT